jgi:hypothetical protein
MYRRAHRVGPRLLAQLLRQARRRRPRRPPQHHAALPADLGQPPGQSLPAAEQPAWARRSFQTQAPRLSEQRAPGGGEAVGLRWWMVTKQHFTSVNHIQICPEGGGAVSLPWNMVT